MELEQLIMPKIASLEPKYVPYEAMYSVPIIIRVSQSLKNDRSNATNAKGTGDKNRLESEPPAKKGHVERRDGNHWMQMQIITRGSWYHREIS